MVKGISRQVIVVDSPDPELFEQAIFILRDNAVGRDGITDAALLKEAKRLVGSFERKESKKMSGAVWAAGGALFTGLVWLISCVL